MMIMQLYLFHLNKLWCTSLKKESVQDMVSYWGANRPKVPREVANVITRLLHITCERSQQLGDLPDEEEKCHTPLQEERHKRLGNYRLVSLISVPGKCVEQIPLEIIPRLLKKTGNKWMTWNSQHWFILGINMQNLPQVWNNLMQQDRCGAGWLESLGVLVLNIIVWIWFSWQR